MKVERSIQAMREREREGGLKANLELDAIQFGSDNKFLII
jgi:hypothetical protein